MLFCMSALGLAALFHIVAFSKPQLLVTGGPVSSLKVNGVLSFFLNRLLYDGPVPGPGKPSP